MTYFVIFSLSRAEFPHFSGQGNWETISTQKGTSSGSLSRQKSVGSKPTERLLSSSSPKGKRDALSKQSG